MTSPPHHASSPRGSEPPLSIDSIEDSYAPSAFSDSRPNAHVPTHAHTVGRGRSMLASTMRTAFVESKLDTLQVLGGPVPGSQDDAHEIRWGRARRSVHDTVGHTGCVNALCWSQSGELLASGSDDTNVVLWKLGTDHIHPSATAAGGAQGSLRKAWEGNTGRFEQATDSAAQYPPLDIGMSAVIQTGHRANIFSVAFAPGSGDRRLFTAAGDHQIRVFDLPRQALGVDPSTSDRASMGGKWYHRYDASRPDVECRTLRCHRGRVKRLATEYSPDIMMSVAEDGDVRLHDLRTHHVCRSACPRPLLHSDIELYSLTVSPLQPHLFAVAGHSPYAYLYDRRMIGRVLEDEWGVPSQPAETSLLTRCVRRFGDPSEIPDRKHITAAKLSEKNGEDLLVTYSEGSIYRFSIHDEPGVKHSASQGETFGASDASSASHASFEDSDDSDGDAVLDLTESELREALRSDSEGSSAERSERRSGSPTEQEANDYPLFRQLLADGEAGDLSSMDEDEDESQDVDGTDSSNSDWTSESEDSDSDEEASAFARAGAVGTPKSLGKVPRTYPRRKYEGHINVDTVKEVNFLGASDEYVISGSDDGNFFVWDTQSGKLLGIWEGDDDVVNVAVAHPTLPVLAVSGIDDTVKIMGPWSRRWKEPNARSSASEERIREAMAWDAPDQSTRWQGASHSTIVDRNYRRLHRRTGIFGFTMPDELTAESIAHLRVRVPDWI